MIRREKKKPERKKLKQKAIIKIKSTFDMTEKENKIFEKKNAHPPTYTAHATVNKIDTGIDTHEIIILVLEIQFLL